MSYLIQRIVWLPISLLLVSVLVFSLMLIIPGDPIAILLGEQANPVLAERLREDMGLDLPVHERYWNWLTKAVKGDFGRSLRTRLEVTSDFQARLRPTAQIAAMALGISLVLGIGFGCISAYYRGSRWDSLVTLGAVAGVCMPHFWLGILLVLFFSVKLRWFPTQGWVDWTVDPVASFRSALLPAVTLALGLTAETTRMTRSAMVEVLTQDYIRTARAKGLKEFSVVWGHALRNGLVVIITIVGLQIGRLVGGAVLTETVFAIPGIGRWVAEAVFHRDFLVVQFAVLVMSLAVMAVNLLTDILYTLVDPRIRY